MNQYEMKQRAYQSDLKNRALQVLIYLIDRSNKEQTCFPAVPTIARELHISISTVKRAMRELVESGYVKKKVRFRESNGGQTSNLYILFFSDEKNEEIQTKDTIEKEDMNDKNIIEIQKREQEHIVEKIYKKLGKKYKEKCWTGEGVNMIPP